MCFLKLPHRRVLTVLLTLQQAVMADARLQGSAVSCRLSLTMILRTQACAT